MAIIPVKNIGEYGILKDLSRHEIPLNAWTDSKNVRFLEGYAYQFLGHKSVYTTVQEAPQIILPYRYNSDAAWIYAGATKQYIAWNNSGTITHTDLTHATARTGVANQWTGCIFGGIPILNANDGTHLPMYWDGNISNNFVDLSNWPASTYCKAIRAFKNILIALNITKTSTNYGYLVKTSHPADPGALPSSWDHTDSSKLATEFDISEGVDIIVDGGTLKTSFIIYKEWSTWRIDFVGGSSVWQLTKLFSPHGIMAKNCWVEFDGLHLVLTQNDVILHDGQTAKQVLDRVTRRWLIDDINPDQRSKCFVTKNPYLHEAWICYPSGESTVPDKALVYNWMSNTTCFRDLPSANCAEYGPVSSANAIGSGAWSDQTDTWDTMTGVWTQFSDVVDRPVLLLGTSDTKLQAVDVDLTFDGQPITSYLERRGLSFEAPEKVKLVRGFRPRVMGEIGKTITFQAGGAWDPWDEPEWTDPVTYTIGDTVAVDLFVSGRYIAIRVNSGSASYWRLDSIDFDIVETGAW